MLPDLEHVEPSPGRSFTWDAFDLPAFPYRWHFHAAYELTLITAGHGRRFVADSIEAFEPGDLVLLGPHLPHTWHSEPHRGRRSKAVVIRFEADCLGAEFFARAELAQIRGLLERARRGLACGDSAAGREAAAAVVRGCESAPFARMVALLEILQALATRGRGRELASPAYVSTVRALDARRIDRVCRHIMQHLALPLRLREVAAIAGLAPESFSRFFHRMTGRTFVAWVHEVRIGHACRLLATTERPVLDVALAAGFTNLSNFNRVFRRLRGVTPGEFKRRVAASRG